MTEEMENFRQMLNEEGIEWEDASSTDWWPTNRTHFDHRGFKWSVIHGYGTYGGFNPLTDQDEGLLELMSDAVNDGDPVGWLTAEQAMEYVIGDK